MTEALTTTLVLSAVSGVLLGLGSFLPKLTRACSILLVLWLAAALPILYFRNVPSQQVLLFYLISAVLGLIFHLGGKPA